MTQGKHSELTLLDHKTDVAALLEAIKDVPCGTARRGRTKTLSQAIAGLPCTNSREPIGKQAVSRLAFAIHAHKAQLEYGRVLRDAYEETKSGDRQANSNLFVSFISMLASRDLDMLLTICRSIDSEWQRVVVETLELELAEKKFRLKSDGNRQSLLEQIREEFGVGEKWTNLPKVGLNAVTVRLCGIFRELTGGPQYGLVGQLLYRADLEDATGIEEHDRYRKLAKRIGDREQRHSQS